jgi:hypothetical protein
MGVKVKAQTETKPSAADLACVKPCAKTLKFMTDNTVPANIGVSTGKYLNAEGYRHINIFVKFSQDTANELAVDLGMMFAFNENGAMASRRYVNLESNVASPQATNFIEVSGAGSWHGAQWKTSSYIARLPIMGPFCKCLSTTKPLSCAKSVFGAI